ncbi:RNase P modulator RnpM [Crassaminicella indica]|uniref:YlxR family protein n=1 Tax=Crassaminicella indica TaxID=2855394 RepID=A0ABX8RBB8_9CLOT|nr:YlxR family protein [Crassaminicella indica]QXM06106.1 YlxR family protein [Crassaminicella indica]
MKVRKIPLRQCIGCMEQKPKKELIRIVRSKDGEIKIDMTGKANGRGAYICNNIECFKKMEKRKALNRAFQQEIDQKIYDQLNEELTKNEK